MNECGVTLRRFLESRPMPSHEPVGRHALGICVTWRRIASRGKHHAPWHRAFTPPPLTLLQLYSLTTAESTFANRTEDEKQYVLRELRGA
jgi:hypothetical protein